MTSQLNGVFASGGADGTVQVWGADDWQSALLKWKHKKAVTCVRFSEPHRVAAAVRDKEAIPIYNLEKGLETLLPCPNTDTLDFQPQQHAVMCTLGRDLRLRMWDVRACRESSSFALPMAVGAYIAKANFAPNGWQVVTCVPDYSTNGIPPVFLWDIRRPGPELQRFAPERVDGRTYDAVASHDGTVVFGVTTKGRVVTWAVSTGELLQSHQAHQGQAWCLAAGRSAVASGGRDGRAMLWETKQPSTVLNGR
eukprot:Hpha_TRINITY_DN15377_c2_g11::TRINITY_DN15377_c2_g11_i1::g.88503::m.88503/K14963/WDR5, SWD3, CPS30; COMPASS component SWD3